MLCCSDSDCSHVQKVAIVSILPAAKSGQKALSEGYFTALKAEVKEQFPFAFPVPQELVCTPMDSGYDPLDPDTPKSYIKKVDAAYRQFLVRHIPPAQRACFCFVVSFVCVCVCVFFFFFAVCLAVGLRVCFLLLTMRCNHSQSVSVCVASFVFWSKARTKWDGCKDGALLPQFICTMNISQLRAPYMQGGDTFTRSVEEQWKINLEQ